jgi:hypothetical protein
MKLPIEVWAEALAWPNEATIAFRESCISYKAGAYRAALLFSYVAWGLVLRRRLMTTAHVPNGIPAGKWNSIQAGLIADDRWDSVVFECTQMKNPAPVFEIPEDVRQQVLFWKDRRNDCAHFKFSQIEAAHVETFWLFLRSNLGRFVPNGSAEALVNQIKLHFDANHTPPNTPVEPLAAAISSSVNQNDLDQFFEDLVATLSVQFLTKTHPRLPELATLFDAVFATSEPNTASRLARFLKKHEDLLLGVLRRNPSRCAILSGDAPTIRRLWREKLFRAGLDIPVYASLLRNSLIPEAEIAEANVHIMPLLNGQIPDPVDVHALNAAGFWVAFEDFCFEQRKIDQFDWGNRNAALISWYVQSTPLSSAATAAICDSFGAEPYPFSVAEALTALFSTSPGKKQELAQGAAALQKPVPTIFG